MPALVAGPLPDSQAFQAAFSAESALASGFSALTLAILAKPRRELQRIDRAADGVGGGG